MIPPDVIEDILRRSSIVDIISQHVSLKKSGHNHIGLCPFHNDKNKPSLSVSDQKGLFHCFACGAGGNVLTFLKDYNKLDFIESIKFLGERVGINVDVYLSGQQDILPLRSKLKSIHVLAQELFKKQLFAMDSPQGEFAVRTVKKRKLDKKTIEQFGIGYGGTHWDQLYKLLKSENFSDEEIIASGLCIQTDKGKIFDRFRERITFPIFDGEGVIVAFGGRALDPNAQAKYVNSPETILFKKGSVLYAWNLAKDLVLEKGELILVEGYMDVIRMFQAGFINTAAPLGTGLTEDRLQFLKNKVDRIILCFDGDIAGQKSSYRSAGIGAQIGIPILVAQLPDTDDPDTFLLEQGPNAMGTLLDQAILAEDFVLQNAQKKLPDNKAFLNAVFEYAFYLEGELQTLSLNIQTELFLKKCAELIGVSFTSVELEFQRFREQYRKNDSWEKESSNNSGEEFQIEFDLLGILIMFPHFTDNVAEILEPDDFQSEEGQEFYKELLLRPENTSQDWLVSAGHRSFISYASKWIEAPDIRVIKNYAVQLRIHSLKKKRDMLINSAIINESSHNQQIINIQNELIHLKQEFYRL